MKNFALSFVVVLLLSGCCHFTSQDCNCEPPHPDLTPETQEWMDPYQDTNILVFENEDGLKDTLSINFEFDTEDCGGDECSSECEIERAILTSNTLPEIQILIFAYENDNIVLNGPEFVEDRLYAEWIVNREEVFVFQESASASLNNEYLFNGETYTVLKIECNDNQLCGDFLITELVISRERGLLEYQLITGQLWGRVE